MGGAAGGHQEQGEKASGCPAKCARDSQAFGACGETQTCVPPAREIVLSPWPNAAAMLGEKIPRFARLFEEGVYPVGLKVNWACAVSLRVSLRKNIDRT